MIFLRQAALGAALIATATWPRSPEPRTPDRGCATFQARERRLTAEAPGPVRGDPLYGRTLATAHFALNYSLAPGVNRIKLTPADSGLRRRVDSLLAALPASPQNARDRALHRALDSLGAPHPLYAVRAGTYFEMARAYYVDSLRMPAPGFTGPARFFQNSRPGLFQVDIADIGAAAGFRGEFYGLTFEPPVSIILENDFLWDARFDPGTGEIIGLPVQSRLSGQVLRDYSEEWEPGVKVTAVHEFYHAIQFTHTPDVHAYHAWYELSATGMEERLAPEVDDYFQYLPPVLREPHRYSLLTPPPANANYGNGIFHQFLTRELGPGFDAVLWRWLELNGNDLQAVLPTLARANGREWDELYSLYAASLAGAGRSDAGRLAFSEDMPRWPVPAIDSIPAAGSFTWTFPPLTFRLFSSPAPGAAASAWGQAPGLPPPTRVRRGPDGLEAAPLAGNPFPLTEVSDTTALFFSVANPHFERDGALLVSRPEDMLAFPNPAARDAGAVFISAPPGIAAGTRLQLISESGRPVADLALAASGGFWVWDLRDAQGNIPPPGVYYFRAGGRMARPLLLLPR